MSPIYHQGKPTIGVLAGWQFYNIATSLNYLMPVYKGIIRAAQERDCNLLLGCGIGIGAGPVEPNRPAWPANTPDDDFVPIGPWNTDGLIIFTPLHSELRSAYVQGLLGQGFPVLFIGSGEQGPTLAADNAGGVREAIRHLVNHGHSQIGFIAGSRDDLAGDTGERFNAFRETLEEHNLAWDPRRMAYGGHVYDGGYAAVQQFLKSGVPFSALLASNDEMALGAMQALKEAGREIPRDVAVIGFDNRLEDAAQRPSLSSVHIPLHTMGKRALELLFGRITSQKELPVNTRVETHLIARESCGCGGTHTPDSYPEVASGAQADIAGISATVLRQTQNLEPDDCRAFCERLLDAFSSGAETGDIASFEKTLEDVLQRSTGEEDDAHIWQDAMTLMNAEYQRTPGISQAALVRADELLDRARLAISSHMQRQHRQYISSLGWISNRLSLLTAALLTALDEDQIYAVLRQHLPTMDIHDASIALYESGEDDPTVWSRMRNVFAPEDAPLRFRSQHFPPRELVARGQSFQLTLVPLAHRSGPPGYVVFNSDHINLYGAIVQQIGGALNTARLYREATEGRRLAEEANRMKSRLLSVIGHELRTPLNLIVGLSEIILKTSDEDETVLPETTQKDIERIHTYSQHLGGLIGDVLDLATSDAGQLRLNNDFVELGQALHVIAESGRQLAADKGLTWEAELPENGPWIWGDRTRLRQVALNLINNAVKFTEHGSVSLRMETHPESVTVLVSDTGLGISAADQHVIFDEFRQSDHSVALGYGGLGLGLAISKRLVELHGGVIGVRSSGIPGAGSTFFFTLPTVPAPVEGGNSLAGLPEAAHSVLVLTDAFSTNELLVKCLHQRGFQVQVQAVNDADGWNPGTSNPALGAVLVDANLAAGSSWKALQVFKNSPQSRDVPVLFFKSSTENSALLELNYLTKPIELGELTRALDQQLSLNNGERPTRAILVVDDEPNTLDLNARIVQSHSAANHVLKARNGREALEILEREAIDLVLLDLQMPEMDGFGVLDRMRENENLSRIPVIVVTGKVLTEEEMARLNRGVATILEKGLFSLDETVEHINAALERKRRLSGEAQRLVRKAMAYIHEHSAESISRPEIAQHVSISEDHLTFCFRQELGTTPIEYLQRYRVQQARLLLKNTERSISEIALDVGFSDSGYFSRIFRRISGMSPETFRRSA
ncbi:transcriptional regulator [Longilinea arvoryzae]|uniref:histidine kinase n=1 Tax=Longilinea arvoryzae TaxID=360412 RepID=A0A0S7BL15_9CHLR|nr:substrate-binding domain-containing protein [Longilinea arvoryzae]GAP15780.1 transcriptional regulator [Longilinea arvoryzae]